MNKNSSIRFISELCPNCGLCCNGVLFADVELQKRDDAERLTELGLSLVKKGRKQAFKQPCSCFDGKLCRVYDERPKRCSTFECGLLKRVQAGELSVETALKKISDTLHHAKEVRALLRRLGQTDEQLALTHRYTEVMNKPIDLSGADGAADWRGELMSRVHDLMQTLQQDFLT